MNSADPMAQAFADAHPDTCANRMITPRQVCWYLSWVGVSIWLALYRWDYFVTIINLLFAFFYFAVIMFRTIAVVRARFGKHIRRYTSEQIATLKDEDLPIYTILVPMYKESNVAGKIIRNIDSLDYPKEKLDVKLLLEEDDTQTIDAARAIGLPSNFEIIIAPDSLPKTKPRACNHGLASARGEYCVIYDAEDRPQPDQLKKAILAFKEAEQEEAEHPNRRKVAVIQAQLNYFNPRQNWLTRFFTIEYTTWYDMYLPGLERMNVPIPLGGTSNHFKTSLLKELGGWDPFNVTEDCDIGIRVHERGYRTSLIESTTWEEANSELWNWIRQRSRWIKGYLQTHLAHTRQPIATFRKLGLWGTFGFHMCVGGMGGMLLLNVLYWIVALIYGGMLGADMLAGRGPWEVIAGERETFRIAWQMIFVGPQEDPFWSSMSVAFFAISCSLILANLFFIGIGMAACAKRGYKDLVGFAILSPIYWVLISVGAWKGFIQLFTNPFYWEKTNHGLDDGSDEHDEHNQNGEGESGEPSTALS